MTRVRRIASLLLALGLTVAGTPGPQAQAQAQVMEAANPQPAVIDKRVIGESVRGRDIVAWHLGEPDRPDAPRVVLIATMHGPEDAPAQILEALRDGATIFGIDLWVVPTYNPDGRVARTRKNARGVDLNRNYPYSWVDLDGNYESGPRAASEPETRAMMAFLSDVRPQWILSFHQPLDGVDTDSKRPRFAARVARELNLPRKSFTCGGVCHGTMTGWYNHNFAGTALTVEYGAHPSRALMRRTAPEQVLSIFDAWRGRIGFDPVEP